MGPLPWQKIVCVEVIQFKVFFKSICLPFQSEWLHLSNFKSILPIYSRANGCTHQTYHFTVNGCTNMNHNEFVHKSTANGCTVIKYNQLVHHSTANGPTIWQIINIINLFIIPLWMAALCAAGRGPIYVEKKSSYEPCWYPIIIRNMLHCEKGV